MGAGGVLIRPQVALVIAFPQMIVASEHIFKAGSSSRGSPEASSTFDLTD